MSTSRSPQQSGDRPGKRPGSDEGSGAVTGAIVRVARLHRMLANQLLRKIGLHPAQELVLMQLWEGGPQRQTDLARVLGTDAATMTRTIQRLEHGGFVRRSPSPTDKRSTIVEATPASLALKDEVERIWDELEHSVAGDLTPLDQAFALEIIDKMERGLVDGLERAGKRPE